MKTKQISESLALFRGRLRSMREGAKLTQQQLADKAKVSKVQIQRLEAGAQGPSLGFAITLGKALGVSVSDFVRREV